jgi:hypothetical protein
LRVRTTGSSARSNGLTYYKYVSPLLENPVTRATAEKVSYWLGSEASARAARLGRTMPWQSSGE